MILCLETATEVCSVALCGQAGVISLKESTEQKSHATMLTVFIDEILKEKNIKVKDLEAVAVSKGPGSYTGLRIGVSVAKGMAFAGSIPLIGIDTTLSMFWGLSEKFRNIHETGLDTLFCPMLDARRMEVYYAIYDINGLIIKSIAAEIITESTFSEIPESTKIIFFGDGAMKCKGIINQKNAYFADDYRISAASMQKPVYVAHSYHQYEDVAYFEPFYLKDFITSIPKKNIL